MATYTRPFNSFTKINPAPFMEFLLEKKDYEAAILAFIYFRMNHENNIFTIPSGIVNGFSRCLGLTTRNTQKLIKSLLDKGCIERIDKNNIRIDPFNANMKTIVKNNLGYVGNPKIRKRNMDVLEILSKLNKLVPAKDIPISKKGKEMDKALKIIETLTAINESQQRSLEGFAQALKNLTPKEIEELPPALKLVVKNGELVE